MKLNGHCRQPSSANRRSSGKWFDAALRLATFDRVAARVVCEPGRLADRLADELRALARRVGKMRCPVQIGFSERRRRNADGETRHGGVERAIGDVREGCHAIGIAVLRLARANVDDNSAADARRRAWPPHPLYRRVGIGGRCRCRSCDFSRLLSRGNHGINPSSANKYKVILFPLARPAP